MAKTKPDELDSFLKEADEHLTPTELRKRAKSGCEYSTYLQNPNPHHGAFLLASKQPIKKSIEEPKRKPAKPLMPDAETNLKMNNKNKQLSEKQILMQKRMSQPSANALSLLWNLGDKLDRIQQYILKLRDTPNKPMSLIKAKQTLAQLNGQLETLQFDGIDAVVTAELKSGRTEAREERKRLTKLAEETHELIHVMAIELKNRFVDAGPDIKLAWKYFYSTTLPNRVLKPGTKDDFRKLEPGESVENSEPYGVWDTPVREIGDFGIGILLYFKMLIGLGSVCLLLGLVLAYNIDYFGHSDEYSTSQMSLSSLSVLKGSAICDDYTAVCLSSTCSCTTDTSVSPPTITSVSGTCAFKKDCDFKAQNAYLNLAVAGVFLLFNFYMGLSHDKIATEADEAEQTAQDYAIMVNDPNPDATDPDEWQTFFSQWGHVSYVTVAYNNGDLLTMLAERANILRSLSFEDVVQSNAKNKKEKSEDEFLQFDHEENAKLFAALSPIQKRSGGLVQNRHKLLQIDDKIQKMVTGTKNISQASKVFVVFEKEASQRRCLVQLTVGTIPAMMDVSASMAKRHIFRGTNVLDVCEAPEPTDVIWENLEVTFKHMVIEQSVTFTLSMGIIALCAYLIYLFHKVDDTGALAATFISVTNSVMPTVLKAINETEEHYTQGGKQTSLLVKLVFLRWMTTGFVVLIVNEATTTLDEKFINKIWAILLADAITTPVLRLMDPANRLGRNYFAKTAPTQEKMNSYFLGASWFLAERYTDMTKTLFVSLFFAAIFPQGLFVTAFAFTVSFWVDKYCLFRLWKQPPAMDGALAVAARFQISLIFLIHCIITQHFFMGWPFDNVEATSTSATMTLNGGSADNTAVLYKAVEKSSYNIFDFSEKSWYTEDQKDIVFIYGILNIVSISVFGVWYFGHSFKYGFHKLFFGTYKSVGDSRDDEFSFVPGIQSYVPMVSHKNLGLPLLACDLAPFNPEHISFTMMDYSRVDLTKSNVFRNVSSSRRKNVFGRVKQYKSQELMDHEIASVEVDMNTIAEWEKANKKATKAMMGLDLHKVGGLGNAGGKNIGAVVGGIKKGAMKTEKKRSSFLWFGGDDRL